MHKKIAVALVGLSVFAGAILPAASTKADNVNLDPVGDAVAALPAGATYKVYPMRITAYSSSPDETAYDPEYTASGLHVADGIVASNLFPFGTKIMMPELFGTKVFTVDDRMAKRFQRTIDIWMPSKTQALNFGVAYTKIVVLGTSTLVSYNPPAPQQAVIDSATQISANIR